MAEPLLLTKLFIPPARPNLVLRPRLVERLNEGLQCMPGVTLISAPAGFGKTSLVSEWLAGPWHCPPGQVCDRSVAWLSLDKEDSELARFLAYLIAAVQTVATNIGEKGLAILQSPQPQSAAILLTILLNEISTLAHNFILVLDDYHLIDSKPVDEALAFLVEHLPGQMRLVIASREDPPLPLPRLRARGQLSELRAADLRFTPAEAAEFLNHGMGLNLSAEDIAALDRRTEGWIAGLQLATLAMQGRDNITGFIQAFTGSHRFVLDYLVEEVLQRQPEQIRSFLLQTSILDRVCARLCNAVTERADGKDMLAILERSNLFLVQLDDQRQWYRYHHLFAEVLQTYLTEALPDQVSRLHLRASAWYEQNGLRSDAIRHALTAKDFERAAGLIELAWPAAEEGSIRPATWLDWVRTLPEELVHARPVLNVWYAYALLGRGEMEAAEARLKAAERWLERAEPLKAYLGALSGETGPASSQGSYGESCQRMVVTDQEQFKSLPAAIAIGHVFIAQARGNLPDTVRYASRVLELVPEGDHLRHGQAAMLLGMAYWASGNMEAAERVFADYTVKLRTAGNIPEAIGTTTVLADIRMALGHLREAKLTIEQLLRFIMDRGEPIHPDTADLHRGLGELYLTQRSLETAAQHLQTCKELGEKAENSVLRYRTWIARAQLNETQGDLEGALALLDEAERLYIRSPLPDFCPTSAMKARIWVTQGRLSEALGWARAQGLSVDDDLAYLREFEHITLARILIAQCQKDQTDGSIHPAIRFLDRLLQAAEAGGRMGSVIEILVLQALAVHALEPLERALTLAEQEGYVQIFVAEGKSIAAYLARIAAKEQTPRLKAYILKLLSAINDLKEAGPCESTPQEETGSSILTKQAVSPQPTLEHKAQLAKSELVEPLSGREMEVLRLLRTDLSGPEIARELIVSLSTLRTHTQNIYAKLGVNNRRAAVRKAEELNLL